MAPLSLAEVVKALRSQPTSDSRASFASEAIEACKVEMASIDGDVKTLALDKLAHLRMLGFDQHNQGDEDTCFHAIEAMALPSFRHKRIACLAASRLLSPDSPVILLLTNSLKKELHHIDPYVVGLALSSLACFSSKDLVRELLPDVCETLRASRPYVRKRGTLALYRMCLRDPEGLLTAYDPLRSKLDDPDPGVVSCAVNAVCELSRTTHAHNILPLTPVLFKLLTTSGNNWMLIKIVKLYCALLSDEPRLARKLLEPLAHIIRTTSAKSLLYECVATATKAITSVKHDHVVDNLVQLCAEKLREFVQDSDQNLKYLGLVGFCDLTKSFPSVAAEHRDLILLCLKDDDLTVRLRALELLAGMTTSKSVTGIVDRLLKHVRDSPAGKFRDATVRAIISACINDDDAMTKFDKLPNMQWFVAVLFDLAGIKHVGHGQLLAHHFVDIALRVPSLQTFCAEMAIEFLVNECGKDRNGRGGGSGAGNNDDDDTQLPPLEFLAACSFVACEFAGENVDTRRLVPILLAAPDLSLHVDLKTQLLFLHNAAKLTTHKEEILQRLDSYCDNDALPQVVRDRAAMLRAAMMKNGSSPYQPTMVSVDRTAQSRVPVPLDVGDLSMPFRDGGVAAGGTDTNITRRPLSFRGKYLQQSHPSPVPISMPVVGVAAVRSTLTPHGGAATSSSSSASPFNLGPLSKSKLRRPEQNSAQQQQQPLQDVDHHQNNDNDADVAHKFKHSSFLMESAMNEVGGKESNGSSPVVLKPFLPAYAMPTSLPTSMANRNKQELTLRDIHVVGQGSSATTSTTTVSPPVPVIPTENNNNVGELEPNKSHKKHKKKNKKHHRKDGNMATTEQEDDLIDLS